MNQLGQTEIRARNREMRIKEAQEGIDKSNHIMLRKLVDIQLGKKQSYASLATSAHAREKE